MVSAAARPQADRPAPVALASHALLLTGEAPLSPESLEPAPGSPPPPAAAPAASRDQPQREAAGDEFHHGSWSAAGPSGAATAAAAAAEASVSGSQQPPAAAPPAATAAPLAPGPSTLTHLQLPPEFGMLPSEATFAETPSVESEGMMQPLPTPHTPAVVFEAEGWQQVRVNNRI
jgi:hypothetical protein